LPAPDHEKQRCDGKQRHQDADLDDLHVGYPPSQYYATIPGSFSFLMAGG
jgi:hypothetical protein